MCICLPWCTEDICEFPYINPYSPRIDFRREPRQILESKVDPRTARIEIFVIVEELIQSPGNFCMILSHPPRYLKGISGSNKKHVVSLNYLGDGCWVIIRKSSHFAWLILGMSIKRIPRGYFDTFFATVMHDTKHKIQLLHWLLRC